MVYKVEKGFSEGLTRAFCDKTLRLRATLGYVYTDLALATPFLHFTACLFFQEKAIQKSSRQSLGTIGVYLQAQRFQTDDRPRRDFW